MHNQVFFPAVLTIRHFKSSGSPCSLGIESLSGLPIPP